MAAHKRPPIPVIVLVVLALVGGGTWWWWWTSTHPATPANQLSGVVETTEYQVAATLAGRIASVEAAEGDQVKAGQVLVKLDTEALDLGVKQAKAGVDAAKAALKQARDDKDSDAEIAAAKAKVTQAEAAVGLAEVQRGYTSVPAPHDGTVVTVTTNAGQNAAPGKTLMTITDPADLFVRVFVPETMLGDVRPGRTASITSDAGAALDGTVTFVATSAQFTPNNVETPEQRAALVYEVQVKITPGAATLLPGQPVDVSFT